MRLRVPSIALLALVLTSAAHAAVAEIRASNGALVGAATGSRFASADGGWTLTVDSVSSSADRSELDGVSLLGGTVSIARVVVPASGLQGAAVDGLSVDGRPVAVRPNTIVALGPRTYLVALQSATLPGRRAAGLVGVRLVVGDNSFGTPAGTQVLVGLARASTPAPAAQRRQGTLPWLLLGVQGAAAPVADPGVLPQFLAAGTIGERAAQLAERFLGIPYVWGGASPLTGFDCSGLAMFVYGQLGIQLTHYTGAQWNEGMRVPPAELRPGDLVFFDMGAGGPGHEGIYLGNGAFVQAPHTGDVVKVSSLSEPRYALAYVGAVRPYGS